jgi:DNA-binding NarL/FixJ family response regulator
VIRVVIVDDHLVYRRGVASLLADSGDVEVVGEAADGRSALACVAATQPDVVLLDLGLPDRSGLALLPDLRSRWPNVRVVVVTMDDEDASIRAALHRGAVGYLLKDATAAELHRALTAAVEGQLTLSASVSGRLAALITDRPATAADDLDRLGLSARDRRLLEFLAQGFSNERIARELGVAPKTIRNQLSLLYTRLGVAERSQAALLARDLGFGPPA